MQCPNCGLRVSEGASFCAECGRRLGGITAPVMTETGARAVPRESGATSPLAPHTDRPAAGRRQLTVMFCDMVGSTELSSRLDPEDLRAIVRTYQAHCVSVISCFGGHVAQFLGDGIMACFGYPVAHDDDAVRAVRASLMIVAELPKLNAQLARPIQLRIGIHAGAVVMGARELFGATPNIAARIQSMAAPNEIVISDQVHGLIEGSFICEPLTTAMLAGSGEPSQIYRVR